MDSTANRDVGDRAHPFPRWAAWLGFSPLLLTGAILALGKFPYPGDNLAGDQYIGYVLAHHLAETQTILWVVVSGALALWFAHLAMAYREQAGHITASIVTIVIGAILYICLSTVTAALFVAPAVFARGYPSFGTNPADFRTITLLWDITNTAYTLATTLLALAFAGIAMSNNAHPVLPRTLGTRLAAAIAVIDLAGVGVLFVDTGPWSPASVGYLLLTAAPSFAWIMVASAFLLRQPYRSATRTARRAAPPPRAAVPGS